MGSFPLTLLLAVPVVVLAGCGDLSACVGVVCVAKDHCHIAGTCDPATGTCSNPTAKDGTACDGGNACTAIDTCESGECVSGKPKQCPALGPCNLGVCDPTTGTCSNSALANGTPCDEGNLCIENETCEAGACTGGNPVICPPSDQCHYEGICDPAGGCTRPPKPDGTACDDGNACTDGDACRAGACVGHVKPDGAACDSVGACSQGTCQGGSCTWTPLVTCTALDACHDPGECDQDTGLCSNRAKTCAALDTCHEVGTCDPGTGTCSNPPSPDGTPCGTFTHCLENTCKDGACGYHGPLGNPAPLVPSGVKASGSCYSSHLFIRVPNIVVTWSPPLDESSSVDGYIIYLDGTSQSQFAGSTARFYDWVVTEGSTHCFQVSAVDCAGNESAKSDSICATATNH